MSIEAESVVYNLFAFLASTAILLNMLEHVADGRIPRTLPWHARAVRRLLVVTDARRSRSGRGSTIFLVTILSALIVLVQFAPISAALRGDSLAGITAFGRIVSIAQLIAFASWSLLLVRRYIRIGRT